MKSIFSTQNLQTFFFRKYWRLPRRGPPGPPGPPGAPSRRPPPGPPSRRPPTECPASRPSRVAAGAGPGACLCSSDITFTLLSDAAPGHGRGAVNSNLEKSLCPPRPPSVRGSILLGRGTRRRSNAARTTGGALFALVSELLLTLQFFVEAHGLILDDRVLDAEAALEFVDKFAVGGAHLLVEIDALAVLHHLVGELAGAPVLRLLDLGAFFGAGVLDRGEDLLDFVFRRRRANDEDQIVQTLFHDDLVSSSSGHVAREIHSLPHFFEERFLASLGMTVPSASRMDREPSTSTAAHLAAGSDPLLSPAPTKPTGRSKDRHYRLAGRDGCTCSWPRRCLRSRSSRSHRQPSKPSPPRLRDRPFSSAAGRKPQDR